MCHLRRKGKKKRKKRERIKIYSQSVFERKHTLKVLSVILDSKHMKFHDIFQDEFPICTLQISTNLKFKTRVCLFTENYRPLSYGEKKE